MSISFFWLLSWKHFNKCKIVLASKFKLLLPMAKFKLFSNYGIFKTYRWSGIGNTDPQKLLHCHVFMHPDNQTSWSCVVMNQYLHQWRLTCLPGAIQPDNWQLPQKYNSGKANYLQGPVFGVVFVNWEKSM